MKTTKIDADINNALARLGKRIASAGNKPPQPALPIAASKPVGRVPDIIPCAPGGCEYLVRLEGKQQECGDPATHRLNGGGRLLYCDLHADVVRKANPKRSDIVRQLRDHEYAALGKLKQPNA